MSLANGGLERFRDHVLRRQVYGPYLNISISAEQDERVFCVMLNVFCKICLVCVCGTVNLSFHMPIVCVLNPIEITKRGIFYLHFPRWQPNI